MTVIVRSESEMYELDARSALQEFSLNRNFLAHIQLARDPFETTMTVEEIVELRAKDTFLYEVLFPKGTSEDEQRDVLREVFTVGAALMSEVEIETGTDLRGRSVEMTGESKKVFDTKIEIALSSFSGVASLRAFALLCGYTAEDVTSLSQDGLAMVSAFVAKFKTHQLRWDILLKCVIADIDPALFTDVMNGRGGLFSASM
jgi:hypothetical protein